MIKKILIILALILVCVVAFYYRVILPEPWLKGEALRLPTVDAYYQARFVDLINSHGTELPEKDPYFMWPNNPPLHPITLWAYMISFVATFFPTQGVELATYYIPPILAIISILCVFFIGTLLFNSWAGLFASLLLASMGGEFMARSLAGSIDYHALEVFLLTVIVLCIVTAIKYHQGWANYACSILAGVSLAVYLRAWSGAIYLYLIFVASYCLYLVVLSIKKEHPLGSVLQVPCVVIPTTVLAYIILARVLNGEIDNNILLASGLFLTVIIVTTLMQIFFVNHNNRWALSTIIALVMVASLLVMYFFANKYFRYINGIIVSIVEWNAISHTSEERPILIFGNEFSLQALWGNFTASIFLCLIGIGVVIKRLQKAPKPELFNYLFITIGALVMLVSTLAMVRFAYYLAVYVALLSGLLIYMILDIAISFIKRNNKKMKWFDKVGDVMLVIIILVFIFVPNFTMSNMFQYPMSGSLTGGWEESMLWMRNNTPEPFDVPGYYYTNYNKNLKDPKYTVMSWWDYGYWITYIGHRVPICNPGSTNREIPAVFLTTTDKDKAVSVLKQFRGKYIAIDFQTATGKFTAMPTYAVKASKDLRDLWSWEAPGYISIFMMGTGDKANRLTIFHPDYYRSMVARLYNFDGRAVKSPGCPVIIYKEINGQKWVQRIIDTPSLAQALKYVDENPLTDGSLYSYGGTDPFLPCVDLEEIKEIRPLKGFGGVDLSQMSQFKKEDYEVKIFEYVGEL